LWLSNSGSDVDVIADEVILEWIGRAENLVIVGASGHS
jgi:hypothetical protein